MIKVIVAGAAGKMGRETCREILRHNDLKLIGAADVMMSGSDLSDLIGYGEKGIVLDERVEDTLKNKKADVVVDFTHPSSVCGNVIAALENGVHAVVGTTGLDQKCIEMISEKANETGKNVIIAPNFAIGAVLMIRLAQIVAVHLPDVEIIELHHDQKVDAPSGTSIKTAEAIAVSRRTSLEEKEKKAIQLNGPRGKTVEGIQVHSVRLPGLVAHQEVIFGGKGQTLTIRHDSIDRSSFMPGVIMAIREVSNRSGMTIGLEELLDI